MKQLVIVALLLTLASCGAHYNGTTCGITVAGDYDDRFAPSWLTNEKLQRVVDKAIEATSLTTDYVLMDQTENCKAMQGYSVYTKDTVYWESYGRRVAGTTNCWTKIVIVNTPTDGNETMTSLVHELFHVMQKCNARAPIDKGLDEDHANWYRDGILWAIEGTKEYNYP